MSGIVIDDRTEQPIRGVLIYVEGQSSFIETDGTGRFRVTVSRKQKITASVIGYALLSTDVEVADAPLEMTIRLSEGAGAYTERVTVSGSLQRGIRRGAREHVAARSRARELRGAVLDDPLRAIRRCRRRRRPMTSTTSLPCAATRFGMSA